MDLVFWTAALLSIGVVITGLEDLSLPRHLFKLNLFDWRFCLALQPKLRPSKDSRVAEFVFSVGVFRLGAIARILGAIITVISLAYVPEYSSVGVALMFFGYLYLFYRIPYSLDGSDQMCLFVLVGLMIMLIGNGDERYMRIGAAAITLQATISYLTSGTAKLISPIWRSGDALLGVMSCAEYGNQRLTDLLKDRSELSLVLSWAIMLGHLFVGLAFLYGEGAVWFGIAGGLIFHFLVALTMRLNIFVWSFAATYPSVLFLADWCERAALVGDVLARYVG